MRHAFIAVFLMFAAGCSMAYTPYRQPLQMEILVNGCVQPKYAHSGRIYLEAVRNEEFTIRLRNNSSTTIAVALSVDGLNTIDAKRTTAAAASKWVVGPWDTVEISGWQVSNRSSRSFYFTNEGDSYGAALGQTRNLGVISAVVFQEKTYTPPPRYARDEDRYPGSDARAGASEKGQGCPAPAAPASAEARSKSCPQPYERKDYAATGMGREQDNQVERVHLNLESTPCQEITVRYEFRDELIRMGVLPRPYYHTPRSRRDTASGFDGGSYCPVVR